MDGVFLSPSEDEFVGRIAEELENFMVQGQQHRVLLFPPLSSRLRYLIHRTVENMELLSSFSVGEGWRRRTVICHSAVRLPTDSTSDPKPGSTPGRCPRPPQPSWGRGSRGSRPRQPGDPPGDPPRASVGSGRISRPPRRKPDKAQYVTRGSWKKANWRERESPGHGGDWGPQNPPRDPRQQWGREGGSPGKQQEAEEENAAGKGRAEHPPCEEKEPCLGNSSNCWERESRDANCSQCAGHSKHPAGEEPSRGQAEIPEGSDSQGQLPEENQSSGNSRELECGKSSVPVENQSSGNSRESESGKSSFPVENQSSGDSRESESGKSSFPVENQSSGDSRGSESGKSSFPVENQSIGDSKGSESGKSSFPVENQSSGDSRESESGESQSSGDSRGLECGKSSFPVESHGSSWAELQTPSLARSKHPAGEQDPGNAEGGRGQESPSSAQVEQNVLEGPREALAAPGRIQGRKEEEEEEKEPLEVAEELRRSLDLGTKQSGLEDDCTAELLAEIVGNLRLKEISIDRVSVASCSPATAQLAQGELAHVTEIYDFPSSMRSEDLLGMFADFHESGFKIQWVDETHALGIFSSPSTASQALGRRYPCLKLRPLLHASRQSKLQALHRPKLLQLGKERPQTDTAVARRFVSHALGWRHRQQQEEPREVFQPESLEQEE